MEKNYPMPVYFQDKPVKYIQHGHFLFAHIRDGNYDIRIAWDGLSDSFNNIEVQYRENEGKTIYRTEDSEYQERKTH